MDIVGIYLILLLVINLVILSTIVFFVFRIRTKSPNDFKRRYNSFFLLKTLVTLKSVRQDSVGQRDYEVFLVRNRLYIKMMTILVSMLIVFGVITYIFITKK